MVGVCDEGVWDRCVRGEERRRECVRTCVWKVWTGVREKCEEGLWAVCGGCEVCVGQVRRGLGGRVWVRRGCRLYTSDDADDLLC